MDYRIFVPKTDAQQRLRDVEHRLNAARPQPGGALCAAIALSSIRAKRNASGPLANGLVPVEVLGIKWVDR